MCLAESVCCYGLSGFRVCRESGLKLYVEAEKGGIVAATIVPDALVGWLDANVVCELHTVGGFKHCLVAKVVVGIVDVDAEGVVNFVGQDVVEEYTCTHVSLASEVD